MILADTSILVGYLKGQSHHKIALFETVLACHMPYGISSYTYQEVLQGARDEGEFEQLREYLSTQTIYSLPANLEIHTQAARMYFDLRRRGVTIRGTLDILIALTAIEHQLLLLHNDHDFDAIANMVPELKIFNSIQEI
jgi:predicted nucleic acid-binding protein